MIINQIDEIIHRIVKQRDHTISLLTNCGYDVSGISNSNSSNNFLCKRLQVTRLCDLKIACVMDKFTLESYTPECILMELTPTNWMDEINEFEPDMLFVESAWEGKNKSWYKKIAGGSLEYSEMVSYSKEKEIPVIFWNKEDPVYTDVFMPAAMLADIVFTTDIDCIARYKTELGHDNVYHLHFAAQPHIHNPIEKYERKNRFCFAGAYYHRYKERAKVFDEFAQELDQTHGIDIYDRNFGAARPEHAFPSSYNRNILGRLDSAEIDKAYKGYIFGINMNSIQQSQTMFARRVFELLASNTVTVGNYSRGVKNYFGDLTICTDSVKTLKQNLNEYCKNDASLRKFRLAGLRLILSEHLYEDRLDYIIRKVYGKSLKKVLPKVSVICRLNNYSKADHIINIFKSQTHDNTALIIINDELNIYDIANILVITEERAKKSKLCEFANEGFISVFDENDYYGANYLLDLVLSTRYCNSDIIGKAAYFRNGEITENDYKRKTYAFNQIISSKRSIFKHTMFSDKTISYVISRVDLIGYSIDEFNYNEGGRNSEMSDDVYIADRGISLAEIEKQSENIKTPFTADAKMIYLANDIINSIPKKIDRNIKVTKYGNYIEFNSILDKDLHTYIYLNNHFDCEALDIQNGKLQIYISGICNCDAIGTFIIIKKNGVEAAPQFTKINNTQLLDVPADAVKIKFALRIKGSGKLELQKIILGKKLIDATHDVKFLSRSNLLILTNQYPSYDDLYRNMFVHRRVKSYYEDGQICDVMKFNIYAKNEYLEFERINIVSGQSGVLSNILNTSNVNTIFVHFLNETMWAVLKNYISKKRIFIWMHGVDVQPWWRRKHNFITDADLNKAKEDSERNLIFWKDVFNNYEDKKIHFIFVSEYLANEVMLDYNINLPESAYSVIHNIIDTDVFTYIKKAPEQRKKILAIKSFANKNYANDIMSKAIASISGYDHFNDLEFYICGDGDRFEEDTKEIKKYKNVHLIKRYLSQTEILEYHKQCGVYLSTTRMDTQGVSRDEAMSSGLVPITNSVAAVPEFVDDSCGILAPGEDYMAIGKAIITLYENPNQFLTLSENAANRVRMQSSKNKTVKKELELMARYTI